MQDTRSGSHPLSRTIFNDATTTNRVLVQEGAFHHVGHCFESTVWVPRGSFGLTGTIVNLTHLIHVDEGVEVGDIDSREGSSDWKAFALETAWCGSDLLNSSGSSALSRGRNLWQFEWIIYGDCRHESTVPRTK